MIDDELLPALGKGGLVQAAGLLSLLTHVAGLGFGVKGPDGRYRLANQAMERLLGQNGGPLTGKLESDFLPASLIKQLARADQCIVDGAATASEEVELAVDGQTARYLWLKLPVHGSDHKLLSIVSIIHPQSPPPEGTAGRQELDHLQQANRELQQAVAELEQVASTDKLTGAWNRRRLEECVRNEMERLERYQHPLSLLIFDIDFFKAVNDDYGHAAGDQVLQTLSTLLQGSRRGADALARWGGEEFVILCPNTNRRTAATLAERLRARIERADFPEVGHLTVSIGVAGCEAGDTWETWFARADAALYRAKASGRNQVQLAPEVKGSVGTEEYVVANLVQLVWRSAYECGDEAIDGGHRMLFADANELLSAMLAGQPAAAVNSMVDKLLADVRQHFDEEEAILVAAGYAGAAAHIAVHRQLIDQSVNIGAEYRAGRQGIGDVFQFLAHEVIAKH
ncbi:diguanylate cyclase, partial [Accumulibacter sp.]|uniref:diguanylate cyclase n=1 Tax=Accumulibacter sp. TaxID=2053492 RepID=UPI0028C43128